MEIPKQRWQKLAGILKEEIGGNSIHVLNDQNSKIVEKPVNGFPYKALQLNIQMDLSESDIEKLINELKTFKDELSRLNTPQQPQ